MFNVLKKNTLILKKLLPYLWITDFKTRFCVSMGLTLLAMVLNLVLPFFLKNIITQLTEGPSLSYDIMSVLLCYGVFWTLSKIILSFRELCMFRIMERGIRCLSFCLMEHLDHLPMSFHTERQTGAITNALERAKYAFPTIFWTLIFFFVPTVLEILGAGIVFFTLYGCVYSSVLIVSTLGFLLFSLVATQGPLKQREQANQADLGVNSRMVETLLHVETIRYSGTSDYELMRRNELFINREKLLTKSLESLEWVRVWQNLIIGLGFGVLIWMTGVDVISGKFTPGDFVLVNGYLLQFFFPLTSFGMLFRDCQTALTDMAHVFHILDTPVPVDRHSPVEPYVAEEGSLRQKSLKKGGPYVAETFRQKDKKKSDVIVFRDVTFGYTSSHPLLKKVSFTIREGQKIAIVGLTGEGKSTIPKLLYRLYQLQQGDIYIHGQNIKHMSPQKLSEIMGIVPQEISLFNETIGYNIAYGHTTASEREITKAVKAARLLDFINSLPDKYETVVGERGLKLSGGEKQRIAMSRLFLKNPPILIFDEPTSSLDSGTTNFIDQSIQKVSKNKTSLLISHKLLSVKNADDILVLHHGSIVERGRHDDLINNNGFYQKLWNEQVKFV